MSITIDTSLLALCGIAYVLMLYRRTRAKRSARSISEPFDYVQIMPSAAKREKSSNWLTINKT